MMILLRSVFVLKELVNFKSILLAVGAFSVLILFVLNYVLHWIVAPDHGKDSRILQEPQVLPYRFPLLKNTMPFLFDGFNFFFKVALVFCLDGFAQCFRRSDVNRRSKSEQVVVRIALLKDDIYLVQGSTNIAEILRKPSLTVTLAYGIALKYCFGMAQKAVDVYIADTSGSQQKPIAGSNVPSQNRVSYLTHENLLKGLLGTGLAPATDRFESALTESLNLETIGQNWEYYPDFLEFHEDHVGAAVIRALFGPTLLSQNLDFVRDLWAYDKVVMSLAKRLPAFWIPNAYRLRDKLLSSIRKWHDFAKENFVNMNGSQHLDDDPLWGSEMIKHRHKMLLGIGNQDSDSVASTDLGFIWA